MKLIENSTWECLISSVRGLIDFHKVKIGHEKITMKFHGGPDRNFGNRHFLKFGKF